MTRSGDVPAATRFHPQGKSPAPPPRDRGSARTDFENLLFDPGTVGAMGHVGRPLVDAWSAEFPDLTGLRQPSGPVVSLSICIATEDIVGPVQNGGIGSTYASLAAMLAAAGHRTTILYLPGNRSESVSSESYVETYAEAGVKLVPVPNYAGREGLTLPKDRWLRISYNMMRYLADNPFDVVHVSEWRGSGFLSLLAKRQGLAFDKTLFIVKTSSPWLWNRMYCSQPLERAEELARIFAERRSVELADLVIGGSAHLLRWMLSHGYRLPVGRTFVQPNFFGIEADSAPSRQAAGTRMPIDEIVFFGRLEGRKGVLLFCHAIARLIRTGVALPKTISFLGKPGARLSARPDQTVIDFIEMETANWPCEVRILSDLQQPEAVDYLLSGPRLAVMPSLIENSSMAIYETLILGIPFLASRVGGTPELIRARDRDHVLLAPHPIEIADKLTTALRDGGYIAAPSFDNARNIEIWRDFHNDLSRGLDQDFTRNRDSAGRPPTFSICIYYPGDIDALMETLGSLETQGDARAELLVAVDAPKPGAFEEVQTALRLRHIPADVIDTSDRDAAASLNDLVGRAVNDYALLVWAGMRLEPTALGKLGAVVMSSDADLFNFFYRITSDGKSRGPVLTGNIVGSLGEGFATTELVAQPLLVRRTAFLKVGGFSTDYRTLGHEQEFMAKAQLAGLLCETALMEVATVPEFSRKWLWDRGYDDVASFLRAVRPQIATAPMPVRDLLLLAKGLLIRPALHQPRLGAARRASVIDGWSMPPILKLATAPRSTAAAWQARRVRRRASDAAERPMSTDAPSETMARLLTDSAERLRRREGRVLFVRDGIVHGWAVDRTGGGRPASVEAVLDGRVVASATADRVLPISAGSVRPDIGDHGFALSLFPGWLQAVRGSRKLTVDVRIAGTSHYLARNRSVFSPSASINRTEYQGFCDRSDDGYVQGWVRSTANGDEEIDVAILLDGVLVGRARADHYREDLVARDIGNGEHGFRFKLADRPKTDRAHVVDVVIAQNGLRLNRSPLVVRDSKITPRWRLMDLLP